MSRITYIITARNVEIVCVLSAAILAFCGINGWGWFIFIAAISHTRIEFGKSDSAKRNPPTP